MRRRRFRVAVLVLVLAGAGAMFALRGTGGMSSGPSSGATGQGGRQAAAQREHEQELRQGLLAAARRERLHILTVEARLRLEAEARLRAALVTK